MIHLRRVAVVGILGLLAAGICMIRGQQTPASPTTGPGSEPPSLLVGLSHLNLLVKEAMQNVPARSLSPALDSLQMAHILIQNFATRHLDALDKPYGQLNEKVRTAFSGLEAVVHTVTTEEQGTNWTVRANTASVANQAQIEQEGGPAIDSYSPRAVVAMRGPGTTVIEVRGVDLNAGQASLELRGVSFLPSSSQDGILRFSVPSSQFDLGQKSTGLLNGVLVVTSKKRRFLLSKRSQVAFDLLFIVVPEVLAKYSVVGETPTSGRESRDVKKPVSVLSRTPIARDRKCVEFRAEEGWSIDTATVKWTETNRENGEFHGVQDASAKGFCLQFTVEGQGARGKGRIEGTVTYSEYRPAKNRAPAQLSSGEVQWGQTVTVPLPEGVKHPKVHLSVYDGSQIVATESTDLGILRVGYDSGGKQLTIVPVSDATIR